MPTPPLLDLPAEPYERGRRHGAAMAALIRDNVETYLDRFASGGLGRAEALALGEEWAPCIERYHAGYHEEMRGVADGSDLPLATIAMLNARYELIYGVFGTEAHGAPDRGIGQEPDGCTSFGLMPEATRERITMIGQNWDWLARIVGHAFVMRVRRTDEPSFVGFTEAGIVGCKMGVNEHGIGLCVNGLVSDRDGQSPFEKPFHVRCKEILDGRTLDKAILPVVQTDRVGSANFLLGQAGGEIIDIEAAPHRCAYLYPDADGVITHANHFEAMPDVRSQMERIGPHTLYRAVRLRRLLKRDLGRLDIARIKAALSDGFGHPGAICRYPDETLPEARRGVTAASIVIDLDRRILYATDGQPDRGDYGVYPLEA
jgi:isopenicillin-N N-acyltransferase-like protein